MRPPGDPFHERLVASYPQIRRFLPRLIEALELEAAGPGRAVLDACQALGDWLTGKPRTTRRLAGELPPDVVTPSWQRHVRDTTGTVDRAGYACCVLDQLRSSPTPATPPSPASPATPASHPTRSPAGKPAATATADTDQP